MSKDKGSKFVDDATNKFTNYSFSDYATKNVKCPKCGMFNPPTREKCKKCGTDVPKTK